MRKYFIDLSNVWVFGFLVIVAWSVFIKSKGRLPQCFYTFIPVFCKEKVRICFFVLYRVTRNNIVWKLKRGYCICYCKTFLLVPDPTECKKNIFCQKVQYIICATLNNIGQRKTTNKERYFCPWLTSSNLKLSCT